METSWGIVLILLSDGCAKIRWWRLLAWIGFWPFPLLCQFAFHDSIHGLYWAQIEPPSNDTFTACNIVTEGVGYITTADFKLFEYNVARAPHWRQIPTPSSAVVRGYYALERDNVWAIVASPQFFRQRLTRWNGRSWQYLKAQNTFDFRVLLFETSTEAWFGCEYGELWHYQSGKWQPEKLPLFIHINGLALGKDGSLFAFLEAPDQLAILKKSEGEWQVLAMQGGFEAAQIAVSPSDVLLLFNASIAPKDTVLGDQPAKYLPYNAIGYFDDSRGYGLRNNAVYAMADTTDWKITESPANLNAISLFSRSFSWIVGADGMILAPQRIPESAPPKKTPDLFAFGQYEFHQLYGMAALRSAQGACRLYLVATGSSNIALNLPLRSRETPEKTTLAAGLNIAGSTIYADYSMQSGEQVINYDQAVITGDLNGDGREDLIVLSLYGHPMVYLHSGHDYYYDATAYSGLKSWGSVLQRPNLGNLFDADHDGDLDLFVACQFRSNAFFVNDGTGHFTEVTGQAGLTTEGGGVGGFVAHFDGDAWEDLYVTTVNRSNILYRNLGPDTLTGIPRFADMSAASGDACHPQITQSQGATIGDFDNDGDFDLFVCNLVGGGRLLQNDGSGRFADVSWQAGIRDTSQSVGASFFDSDNDGWLDLLVANKGFECFYRNNGRPSHQWITCTFEDLSKRLSSSRSGKNLIMASSHQYGGNSSGTLALDWDGDLDLEALVSSYDTGLYVMENTLNRPSTAIQITPVGIKSNRSAVGTRVILYESSSSDSLVKITGMRMIESASSYGCAPPKLAHFGVDPDQEYEAKIIFPSGIVHKLIGLRGGQNIVVNEVEGLSAEYLKAGRTLANSMKGFRSFGRNIVLALTGMMILLVSWVGQRIGGLAGGDIGRLAVLCAVTSLACVLLWFAKDETTFVMRPLAVSLFVTLLAFVIIRGHRLYQARPASLEMLQARLTSFDHGAIIRQLSERFVFFAENLGAEQSLSVTTRARFAEATVGLHHMLDEEIRAILRLQYGINFAVDLAVRLDSTWNSLRHRLSRTRRVLEAGDHPTSKSLSQTVRLLERLQENVHQTRDRLITEHNAAAEEVVAEVVKRLDHKNIEVKTDRDLPKAFIRAADLQYVIDELIQNALRHIDGQAPRLCLSMRQVYDELQIDLRDNGPGVPRHLWDTIFHPGFTTKPSGKGGFGLAHARQRLARYGGKIFVADSAPDEGTTMRICLPIAN